MFCLLHILTNTGYKGRLSHSSYSIVVVISHCSFHVHFPTKDVEYLFMGLLLMLVISLFKSLANFKKQSGYPVTEF